MKLFMPVSMTMKWHSLRGRIQARPDSEFHQSLIRLAICIIFYLFFSNENITLTEEARRTALLILAAFFFCGYVPYPHHAH